MQRRTSITMAFTSARKESRYLEEHSDAQKHQQLVVDFSTFCCYYDCASFGTPGKTPSPKPGAAGRRLPLKLKKKKCLIGKTEDSIQCEPWRLRFDYEERQRC